MSSGNEARLHQRACEVMAEAIELPISERNAYLARECGGDGELRARVERLLEHHRAKGPLTPLVDSHELDVEGAVAESGEAAAAAPPHPERIGPFRIVRELGRGSHGVVCEAEQEAPRRRVALKVLQPGWLSAAQAGRFEREAAALARFHHPGLAAIHEAGRAETAGGRLPWFAMELVEGLPLDQWVAVRQPPRRARIELLAQIAAAVQHAHEHGVIHRDLKPANVLVQSDGRAKVVDFGVAALLDPDTATLEQLTASGAFVGTLAYVSPEQASGATSQVDARADVYSLGVMAYELLVGRLPYETRDRSLSAALRLIAEFEPVALRRIDPAIPLDLENLVRKAMEKDPARRYQDAAALHADLQAWLDERPVSARAPSALYVATKFARRHRGLVVGLAIALAALVAGFVMLSIGLARARDALQVSETRRVGALGLIARLIGLLNEAEELPGGSVVVERALAFVRQMVDEYRLEPAATERDERVLTAWANLLLAEGSLLQKNGQRERAEANFRANLACRGRLRELPSGDLAARIARERAWSVAHVRLGDVEKDRGEYAAAAPWYATAMLLDLALVEAHPGDAGCQSNLCYSWERRADLALLRGDSAEAVEFATKRITATERLVAMRGDDLDAKFELARALLFRVHLDDSEPERAPLERAYQLIREVTAAPGAKRTQRLLEAHIVGNLATVTSNANDYAGAMRWMTDYLPKIEQLERDHPGDAEITELRWRSEAVVANALNHLGEAATSLVRFDVVRAAIEARRAALPHGSVAREQLEMTLVSILCLRVEAFAHLGDLAAVRRAVDEILALADDLLARRPLYEAAAFEAASVCFQDASVRAGCFPIGRDRLLAYFPRYPNSRPGVAAMLLHRLDVYGHHALARELVAGLRALPRSWSPADEAALSKVEAAAAAEGQR